MQGQSAINFFALCHNIDKMLKFCYYVFTISKINSATIFCELQPTEETPNKNKHMKSKSLHRHLHPIHWHGSMYVAIAAILLTTVKCSGEMIKALHAVPVHADVMNSVFMRDAENMHLAVILNSGVRHATNSGR